MARPRLVVTQPGPLNGATEAMFVMPPRAATPQDVFGRLNGLHDEAFLSRVAPQDLKGHGFALAEDSVEASMQLAAMKILRFWKLRNTPRSVKR
jgi:hypothetical protein